MAPTLTKYLGSIVAVALNIALVLGFLGYFGIQTTSFAAMLAGADVAIGADWSGLLGHFAADAFTSTRCLCAGASVWPNWPTAWTHSTRSRA